jgi:hypothetical protein
VKEYQPAKDKSTGSMMKHLRKEHPNSLRNSETSNGNIERFLTIALEKVPYTSEAYFSSLVKWITADDQPFTVVEGMFFRKLTRVLNSEAKFFSATTVRNQVITTYTEEQNKIRKELQEAPGRISFTLDAWTSTTQIPFLGITAHWITADWEMKSTIIDFVHLQGPHSGNNLADAFYKVLKDYGILTKVGLRINF